MPELPEVETVRSGLAPLVEGRRILSVEKRRPDLRFPLPERFEARLTGTKVVRVGRRAKYLLFELGSGETLIAHLGMSGRYAAEQGGRSAEGPQLVNAPSDGRDPKHDHVVFTFEGGLKVTYNDPRRFGFMDLAATDTIEGHAFFEGMGPEPLSNAFNGPVLTEALSGKQTPIKAALLDQRVVAGLGNIYVCEALFRARIDPRRAAGSVSRPALTRLVPAIREVLEQAIGDGGSTLRDYAQPDGELGYFATRFAVYDREGQPCARDDGGTIRRIVQGGRSTWFCPKCQK